MTRLALTLLFLAAGAIALGADANHRFVHLFHFPSGSEVLVVAEGDLEPRSIGSYTLRVYAGNLDQFSTDEFITGMVRPRNGTIEAVQLADVDGDGRADVVVLMRSAGSGGYLAADAFRYSHRSLELIGSVAGLGKAADVIAALRDQLKSPAAVEGH